MTHEPDDGPKLFSAQQLDAILRSSGRMIYYGATILLITTVGMLFVSTVISIVQVPEVGVLQTALTVLDRVLLIFIFVELLDTIGIVIREREIFADPFLLIGLIAVVRRILLVTAETGQVASPEEFQNLLIELGVLTALVIALAAALYFTWRTRRSPPEQEPENS
jgi:uncharacterized membrane protein (DUF373 family)